MLNKDKIKLIFNNKLTVNIYYYLILVLAIMLPYLGLLSVLDKSSIISVLSKELLVLVIIFMSLMFIIRIPKFFYCFLLLIFASMVMSIYLGQDLKAILLGIKYDFLPIILLLLVALSSKISLHRAKILIRLITYNALFLSIIAICQQLFPTWWESIGFNASNVNPYQLVDPALDMIRSFVFSSGPNQFALYLTMILGLRLYYPDLYQESGFRRIMFTAIIMAGIMMTFSRSAVVAMSFILLPKIFSSVRYYFKGGFKLWGVILAISIAIMTIAVMIYKDMNQGSKIGYFIHHGRIFDSQLQGSDSFRVQALKKSWQDIKSRPLTGYGLASIGPASLHTGKEHVSENWFLQIIYELGIPLGIIYYVLIYRIWGYLGLGPRAFMAIAAPIIVVGLFLHSFSDSMIGYSGAILLALLSKIENQSVWASIS